jgi:hypothetical protein
MFKTKWQTQEPQFSEPGSRFAPVYSLASKEHGCFELEITGEKDIYTEIQSHADSVDIKNIMLRYELGDENILQQRTGMYVDITGLPTNQAEVNAITITAKNQFDSLPLEL